MKPAFKIIAIVTAVILVSGAVGFIGGYFIKGSDSRLSSSFDRLGQRVTSLLMGTAGSNAGKKKHRRQTASTAAAGERTSYRIASIFVPLQGESVVLPAPDRVGAGGGLTSYDNLVLLLRFDGALFSVNNELDVQALDIQVPDYGFLDYQQRAASEEFASYSHAMHYFRYNDIAYFDTGSMRGLLISYTYFDDENRCYRTRIARLVLDQSATDLSALSVAAEDWEILFETSPCLLLDPAGTALEGHMAGGRMVLDGDQGFYLASGSYGGYGSAGPRDHSSGKPYTGPPAEQDSAADYGKVIHIDIEDGSYRHISRGHRNTQGIALDREGQVWVTEHGLRGGDELNLVEEGLNYGWPYVTYGTLYSGLRVPGVESFGRHDGYELPRMAWLPAIAVSSLARVEGFHSAWDGDLMVATLRSNMLVRIRVVEERVVFSEYIEVGKRVRDVHQHTTGKLALWTDENEFIFLSPTEGGVGQKYVDYRLDKLSGKQVNVDKLRIAMDRCAECHSFNRGENQTAPSLADIYGSKIGATDFAHYSAAMNTDERTWTDQNLSEFLSAPAQFIAGTSMPDSAIDADTVGHIVAVLKGLAADKKIPAKYRDPGVRQVEQ